jgi:hypothetical protein
MPTHSAPRERPRRDPRSHTTRSRRQHRRHPPCRGTAVRDRARMGHRRTRLRRRVPPLLAAASLREQHRLPDALAANPGLVRVEHRRCGEQFLSNRYHVRTTAPAHTPTIDGGGRISAATPESPKLGGRTSAARVAADVRPNPKILTDKVPPPPPSRVGRSSAPKAVEEADWLSDPSPCVRPHTTGRQGRAPFSTVASFEYHGGPSMSCGPAGTHGIRPVLGTTELTTCG